MLGKYKDHDNVEDFIEHFLLRLADRFAKAGNTAIADSIYVALDAYLIGDIGIELVNGQAYTYNIDNKGVITKSSAEKLDCEAYEWPEKE